MSHIQLAPNIYDCSSCQTRCDGKSIGVYDFEKDVNFSEAIEEQVIKQINKSNPNLFAFKTKKNGYPDIEIISKTSIDKPVCYIEIKVQSRTFMSIERILPNSNLKPSETIALNISDLERYFEIYEKEKTDLYIVWCLKNRNCINNQNTDLYFHQNIIDLKKIRLNDTTNYRKFKRATGIGDIINGEHKGVLVNYHFSLNELIQGIPTIPNH